MWVNYYNEHQTKIWEILFFLCDTFHWFVTKLRLETLAFIGRRRRRRGAAIFHSIWIAIFVDSTELLQLSRCDNKIVFFFFWMGKRSKEFSFFFSSFDPPNKNPLSVGEGGGEPFFFYNLKKKRKFFQTPTKQSGTKERNADTMKSSRPPLLFSNLLFLNLLLSFLHRVPPSLFLFVPYTLLSFCVCVCVVPPSDIMSASGAPYGMHVGLFLFAAILHSFLKNKKKKKRSFYFSAKKKKDFFECADWRKREKSRRGCFNSWGNRNKRTG